MARPVGRVPAAAVRSAIEQSAEQVHVHGAPISVAWGQSWTGRYVIAVEV